jgi:hypothetical protein
MVVQHRVKKCKNVEIVLYVNKNYSITSTFFAQYRTIFILKASYMYMYQHISISLVQPIFRQKMSK